jgi:tripartite-type tricarboxylate transporter receptor subunit TctC
MVKMLKRRQAFQTAASAGITLAAPALAQASYPNKPVRFVVPFPPGQATDILTRLLADRLSNVWRQQVIVDNKGGGSGIPACESVKHATPDGYTLILGTSGPFGINPSLIPDLPYNPLVDFDPISLLFLVPLVIVAHPSFPANSLVELIALAKKEPGQYSYASGGPGSSQHLSMELFKLKTGIDILHVPYKGSGPAMADLLGGHVKLMMDSTASAQSGLLDKRIKAFGVTTARHAPAPLDGIPSIGETVEGYDTAGWAGLAAPAKTPPEIVAKISGDVQAQLRDLDVIKHVEEKSSIAAPGTPAEFSAFLKKEIETWATVVKATGTRL